MKKLKILAIILCVIAFLAIILGIVMKKDKKLNNSSEVPIEPSIQRQIKEERCYKELCINAITIEHAKDEEGSSIQFMIENRGVETINEGNLKLLFDNDSSKIFSYPTLKPKETAEIVIYCSNEEIELAKHFSLEIPNI